MRALFAALLLGPLAGFSGIYSLANSLDTHEPHFSHSIYAELPKAKVRIGDLTVAASIEDDTAHSNASAIAASLPVTDAIQIETLALSSLMDTPYAPGALRQLAFVETDASRRAALLDLAQRSSRRDVATAAQIAELQFRDGSLKTGLETLDTALSISDTLDARIFPLMLRATQDPSFASLLRKRLAHDPEWGERLAAHASSNKSSAQLFADIADGLPSNSRALSLDYGAPLVDQLASQLQPEAAFTAYAAYADGPQDVSAFGGGVLPPLDWQLIDNLETGTRRLGARESAVELFAAPRRSGEVARIMLRLDPGFYALDLSLADPRGTAGKITLTRTCLIEGRELTQTEAEVSLDADIARLAFSVPFGCPYQSLRLSASASGEAVSVLVEDVALAPLRARPQS